MECADMSVYEELGSEVEGRSAVVTLMVDSRGDIGEVQSGSEEVEASIESCLRISGSGRRIERLVMLSRR